jgi:hypothetical protein
VYPDVCRALGGPGGSGIEMVMEEGQSLRRLLGDQWDLIGFDPRGIGRTRSALSIFSPRMRSRQYTGR